MDGRRLTLDAGARDDLLRLLGGLLFGVGMIALFLRKENIDAWGDFGRLLVLLVPCLLLLGLGLGMIGGDSRQPVEDDAGARPWRAVVLVLGIVLVPLTLLQFVALLGGSPDDPLNRAWIFAASAVVAALAALRARLPFAALLAALAALIAFVSLWDKILDPSGRGIRQLMVIAAILLIAGAVVLRRRGFPYAGELVTAGGVAAVLAGVLGAGAVIVKMAVADSLGAFGVSGLGGLLQQEHWNLFLLVVSVALIVYGTAIAARGPVYVGGFGIFFFVVSIGSELASRASDGRPDGSLVGWPLILILLGAAGIAAGFFLLGEGGGRPAIRRPGRRPQAPADGTEPTATHPARPG